MAAIWTKKLYEAILAKRVLFDEIHTTSNQNFRLGEKYDNFSFTNERIFVKNSRIMAASGVSSTFHTIKMKNIVRMVDLKRLSVRIFREIEGFQVRSQEITTQKLISRKIWMAEKYWNYNTRVHIVEITEIYSNTF